MADIFVSYSREDYDRVTVLAEALRSEGYTLWWDHNLSAGGRFVAEIEEQLDKARIVLVVWSKASVKSMWVADEANVGLERDILIPVSLDGVRPKLGFRQVQTIDLSTWNGGLPDNFETLKAALAGRIGPDTPKPSVVPVQHKENKPWIVMEALKAPPGDEELSELADALGEEIGSALSRFPHLLVASANQKDPGLNVRYEIQGSLRRGGSKLRLTMQLRDRIKGNQVWGSRIDRITDDVLDFDLQDDLVDHIVSAIADPYGALVRDLCADVEHKDLQLQTAYELSLRQFIYKQRIDASEHLVLRDAANLAVERAPNDPNAWASLAHASIEEYKHEFNRQPGARTRALKAIRKALNLGPNNAYANFQLAEIQYYRQDLGAFRAGTERAINLNPRDSESMAMLGILTCYAGDWERGLEMTERAMALNPDHPGWYRFGAFFYRYLQGEYATALEVAERINMPNYFADPYARCVAHAQLGNTAAAEAARDEFLALWPTAREDFMEQHFNRWVFAQPELVQRVKEGFAKVGLIFV